MAFKQLLNTQYIINNCYDIEVV